MRLNEKELVYLIWGLQIAVCMFVVAVDLLL